MEHKNNSCIDYCRFIEKLDQRWFLSIRLALRGKYLVNSNKLNRNLRNRQSVEDWRHLYINGYPYLLQFDKLRYVYRMGSFGRYLYLQMALNADKDSSRLYCFSSRNF